LIDQIEALVRRDPASRGLISSEAQFGPLCPGHLAQAAESLAKNGRSVAIVTGFFVPDAELPAAETDGPPGAVVLAMALESVGIRSTLVTDPKCGSAVRAAARAAEGKRLTIEICSDPVGWFETFVRTESGARLSHLIAVERVGPSHDRSSLIGQSRKAAAPVDEFEATVPIEHRNRCHNVRGSLIDETTAPLHVLFELGPKRLPGLKTIGIGDGGNEIGMGCIAWEELARRICGGAHSAFAPCRIATDWNLIAGTSNWGAFALAAATLFLMQRVESLVAMDNAFHRRLLERMVAEGPAIDGMTRRRETTVDGLPFETYIQSWLGIRRLLGVEPAQHEEQQ
jgi:hypothetical protein